MSEQADKTQTQDTPAPDAIILAAGKGTRMGDDSDDAPPKVMYEVAGRPMLWWVVRACRDAGVARIIIIVGHRADLVRAQFIGENSCEFVEQDQQLGTGHATRVAQPLFERLPARDVFVLMGDGPLIHSKTLVRLLEVHRRRRSAGTLATSVLNDPTGYGRIIRTAGGEFDRIVEQKDATADQQKINEINPSYYCFRSDALFSALADVENRNAAGEYYLTDVPGVLKQRGETVTVVEAVPPGDVLGINTPEELARVDRLLRDRQALTAIPGAKR